MNKSTRNKIIITALSITVVALIIVATVFVYRKNNSTSDSTSVTTVSSNEMSFVDAHGQWYEFIPDSRVEATSFDKDKFKLVNGKMTYMGNDATYRLGIDVSEFNGDIDWNAVKNDGIEFVFIRIGGRGYGAAGNLYADKRFDEYYSGAKAAGLDVGCYFFSQAINEDEAVEEAKYVLNLLNGRKPELPIAYDPESILNDDARTDGVSGEQFTKNCIAFFDTIDNANKVSDYSYTSIIYSNMVWEAFMLDLNKLSDYDIWYADYELKPQTPYHYSIWQYSEKGSIAGISGAVDLDIMCLDT